MPSASYSTDQNTNSSHIKSYYSVTEGSQGLALASILQTSGADILHIAHNDRDLEQLAQSCRFFAPDTAVLTFPAWDCLPYDRISPNPAVVAQRVMTLAELNKASPKPRVILTTASAILQRVPPKSLFDAASLTLVTGGELAENDLKAFLLHNGYQRVSKVMEAGEYSLRGNIIDIFPPGEEEALRMDLFGDEIESIRWFDVLTQRSGKPCNSHTLLPVSEVLLKDDTISRFREGYRHHFGTGKDDPLYESVSHGRVYAGMEHWLPLFYEQMETLFDYVPNATITQAYHLQNTIDDRHETLRDYYEARTIVKENARIGEAYNALSPKELYLTDTEWQTYLAAFHTVQFSPFAAAEASHSSLTEEKSVSLKAKSAPDLSKLRHEHGGNAIKALTERLPKNSKPIIFATNSVGSADRLRTMLDRHDVTPVNCLHWRECLRLDAGQCGVALLPINTGFETPELILYSEQDVFGERIIRTQKKRKKSDIFMAEAAGIEAGELVVHKEHGIGRFDGLVTMEAAGTRHDCLKLVYDGEDKLFLPVENSDMISRHGSEKEDAQLDKLGSASWQNRKARMKKRIKMAAEELLSIAAKRRLKKGKIIEPSNGAYDDFAQRFAYDPTDDQQRAIDETLSDLASGQPMDRLVCGDVGFGKTEVAMRAAFAAVSNQEQKMQVAVIVPTTLLARQHYHNFLERFEDMGIKVRMLSRLAKPKAMAETHEMLADGACDIVIGTHALLTDKVRYHNLGLVIVDEEQRFGVKQKEKLKKMRANVHMLTLSATPIPRTLQLALSGVRELSLITTPPVDRLAIRSFVMPRDDTVLREAIMREYHRGGKTFYVTPRIKYMAEIHARLKELVPELKIAAAHGQMAAGELDDLMNTFYEGEYDILLSTTIIESGIDVPSANTMIIDRADLYGLAQLYQLRGRVGRSKTRAYCYFTTEPRKTLTNNATKRLEVMQKLDSLGAGFALASHDMDIRGFGNLVGEEQSGHVREVGVELYQQMLEEAIAKAKEGHDMDDTESPDEWSPTIKLGASALIPENYVEDLSLRMGLYRRLAFLKTPEDIESFGAELADRFGTVPEEVNQLLEIVRIKQFCKASGVERVDVGPKGAVLSFHNNAFAAPEKLIHHISKNPKKYKLRADQKLVVIAKWNTTQQRMRGVSEAITNISSLIH